MLSFLGLLMTLLFWILWHSFDNVTTVKNTISLKQLGWKAQPVTSAVRLFHVWPRAVQLSSAFAPSGQQSSRGTQKIPRPWCAHDIGILWFGCTDWGAAEEGIWQMWLAAHHWPSERAIIWVGLTWPQEPFPCESSSGTEPQRDLKWDKESHGDTAFGDGGDTQGMCVASMNRVWLPVDTLWGNKHTAMSYVLPKEVDPELQLRTHPGQHLCISLYVKPWAEKPWCAQTSDLQNSWPVSGCSTKLLNLQEFVMQPRE